MNGETTGSAGVEATDWADATPTVAATTDSAPANATSGYSGDICGVVILGGGTGERLGGVSKPELVVAGRSLLEWSLSQLPPTPTVLVAPETVAVPAGVGLLMEDPPRSGPAAGFAAGVAYLSEVGALEVSSDSEVSASTGSRLPGRNPDPTENGAKGLGKEEALVALVPVDAPLAGRCLSVLERALRANRDWDGVLAEADGVRQNVLGLFRLSPLRWAFSEGVTNTSMRRVLSRLSVGTAEVQADWVRDADTPADLAALTEILSASN